MKPLIFLILFFSSFLLFAQTNKGTFKVRKVIKGKEAKESLFKGRARRPIFVPQAEWTPTINGPKYPGGKIAMLKFIADNLIYPAVEKSKKISASVQVGFSVEKDGTVSNPQVLTGQSKSFNEEAVRLVKLMPKWIPKNVNGIDVTSAHNNIIINFFYQN